MSTTIINEVVGFLKKIPPFHLLEESELAALAINMTMDFYAKDTAILREDGTPSEYLRIIKRGAVRVSLKSEAGEDTVIEYRGDGDTFGLVSLLSGDRQRTTVTAVDDTVCYLIDKKRVMGFFDSKPEVMEYFLKSHFSKYINTTYKEMHNKSLYYGSSDHLLFTTQIGELATKRVVTIKEDASIQEAAQKMATNKISSLIVTDKSNLPIGIITDRDLRERVVAKGRDFQEPVKNIMSPPLIRVDARDYCFDALLKMVKHNVHHILVIKDGELKGILTNHDLMMLQGSSPFSFVKDIENQRTIEGLIPMSKKVNRVIGLLLKEGAMASNITKILTELNDRLAKKVLEIAEMKFGKPPVAYCWIVYGSEGRKEQTFKTDQDNAIIYADIDAPEKMEEAKRYFAGFTEFVKESLVKCGFPLCPANYMASNPEWRQPLSVWKKYFSKWISSPTPDSILKSLIFFDFRPLYGDAGLTENLRAYLVKTLKGQNLFFAKMAGVVVKNRPPLGFLKTFIVEKTGEHKDKLDLKINGIGPLVDSVRLFALEAGISETSTLERIKALKEKNALFREMGGELEHSFEFITLLRIHNQLEQIERGQALDNFIKPGKLSSLEKKSLKESFQVISKMQGIMIDQYGPGMVGG